jgi:hypothetical protein
MSELHRSPQAADQPSLADASREILQRIIKLRQMGMEREARRLQRTLAQAPPAGGEVAAER